MQKRNPAALPINVNRAKYSRVLNQSADKAGSYR
jgi:hypothetical protein